MYKGTRENNHLKSICVQYIIHILQLQTLIYTLQSHFVLPNFALFGRVDEI